MTDPLTMLWEATDRSPDATCDALFAALPAARDIADARGIHDAVAYLRAAVEHLAPTDTRLFRRVARRVIAQERARLAREWIARASQAPLPGMRVHR